MICVAPCQKDCEAAAEDDDDDGGDGSGGVANDDKLCLAWLCLCLCVCHDRCLASMIFFSTSSFAASSNSAAVLALSNSAAIRWCASSPLSALLAVRLAKSIELSVSKSSLGEICPLNQPPEKMDAFCRSASFCLAHSSSSVICLIPSTKASARTNSAG